MYRLFKKRVTKPICWLIFLVFSLVPEFVLRVQIVVLDKKRRLLFGAILSGITSPFSTLAKLSAARGRLDFFFLEIHFYNSEQAFC